MEQIICGDCILRMRKLEKHSVDLFVCDLPYGTKAEKVPLKSLWNRLLFVGKPNATYVFFGSGMFTAKIMMSNPKMWRYNIVWKKGERTSGFLNANRQPMRNHEDIVVFSGRKSTYNPQMEQCGLRKRNHSNQRAVRQETNNCYGDFETVESNIVDNKYPKSVLDIQPDNRKRGHPNEKPVPLMEWIVKTYSNPDDTVLDCCMGSGSTGVACVNTGRNFIGIDISDRYVKTAQKRIQEAHERHEWINTLPYDQTGVNAPLKGQISIWDD